MIIVIYFIPPYVTIYIYLTFSIWPIRLFYIPLHLVLVQTMNKKRLILLNLGWFSYSFLFKIMEYQGSIDFS